MAQYIKVEEDGYEIQVGDVIGAESNWGKFNRPVTRVTKKYAFVRYNDVAEGKFPRIYNSFWFGSVPRDTWSTTRYTLYKKTASE